MWSLSHSVLLGNKGENKPVKKLKPCPFCGHKAKLEIKNDNTTNHNTKIRVGCVKLGCCAHFENSLYGSPSKEIIESKGDDLIKKWNRRM